MLETLACASGRLGRKTYPHTGNGYGKLPFMSPVAALPSLPPPSNGWKCLRLWSRSRRCVVAMAMVSAVLVSASILGAVAIHDDSPTDQQQQQDLLVSNSQSSRVENLRLVRTLSSPNAHVRRPLRGIDLANQNLSGLQLPSANLVDAQLMGAFLVGVYLTDADLTHATLAGANASGVNLYNASMYGTKLAGVDFSGAYMRHANLAYSDLSGAILIGADLFEADLTGVNLDNVCWDDSTRWPTDFGALPSPRSC